MPSPSEKSKERPRVFGETRRENVGRIYDCQRDTEGGDWNVDWCGQDVKDIHLPYAKPSDITRSTSINVEDSVLDNGSGGMDVLIVQIGLRINDSEI